MTSRCVWTEGGVDHPARDAAHRPVVDRDQGGPASPSPVAALRKVGRASGVCAWLVAFFAGCPAGERGTGDALGLWPPLAVALQASEETPAALVLGDLRVGHRVTARCSGTDLGCWLQVSAFRIHDGRREHPWYELEVRDGDPSGGGMVAWALVSQRAATLYCADTGHPHGEVCARLQTHLSRSAPPLRRSDRPDPPWSGVPLGAREAEGAAPADSFLAAAPVVPVTELRERIAQRHQGLLPAAGAPRAMWVLCGPPGARLRAAALDGGRQRWAPHDGPGAPSEISEGAADDVRLGCADHEEPLGVLQVLREVRLPSRPFTGSGGSGAESAVPARAGGEGVEPGTRREAVHAAMRAQRLPIRRARVGAPWADAWERPHCLTLARSLSATLVASGIPARTALGLALREGRWRHHAWVEYEDGVWRGVDPTWGRDSLPVTYLRLAWDEDESAHHYAQWMGQLRFAWLSEGRRP